MLNEMDDFFSLLKEYLENPESLTIEEQGKVLAETFLYGNQYN